jgi:tetratricopeptide (TPR) repeat protein
MALAVPGSPTPACSRPEGAPVSVGRNDPCPCGSGKKFKHCHGGTAGKSAAAGANPLAALLGPGQKLLLQGEYARAGELFCQALAIDPEQADARHFLGMAMCFTGDRAQGIAHIRASLALRPDNAIFHNNYAYWLEKTSDLKAAEAHLACALAIQPDYHQARASLIKLLMQRRLYAAARIHLDILMRVDPDDPELRYRLAEVLFNLRENAAMEKEYRGLIARAPGDTSLRLDLAKKFQAIGQNDDAMTEYEEALALEPGNIKALSCMALVEEGRHRLEESERRAQAGLALQPDDGLLHLVMARIRRRQGRLDEALDLLQRIEPGKLHPAIQPDPWFETGMVLDKQKRCDEAFDAFRRANDSDRARLAGRADEPLYSIEHHRARFDALKCFFTRAQLAALAPCQPPAPGPEPVFIVGFPRSGTTLTEQMLAAHPAIHAGGELPGMKLIEEFAASQLLESRQPYPPCLAEAAAPGKHNALCRLRDYYLHIASESRAMVPDKRHFTDKMPLNETHLGLIWLLFPQSPVIHVVRHPLDVLFSCYSNRLTHGDNVALSLETLAFHYAETWKLVEHYLAEMDLKYTRLRYEDLIQRPEEEMRRLLEFVGEPWDPRCLDFHNSGRVARTASYAQVSQPLYRTSQERWRPYRKHLESVIPALKPLIEQLGYSTD